ncbi:MAG: 50S ribosomal protein L22 [Saprospiraceae bacterium]|nr:50S ribosomal protein L22 [Bacteroidia bacterium]MBT8230350.1 50S ribosomal protein L22 [Bacteroidia bacterium]NNF20305.1 50S ribosomal protein L22 [Saprospiraceae bacterium]NNK89009.1 50S ribosomal protein L22 [Saprospiraceae bacterium]
MEAIAKLKNVPLSARKMRFVVDSIRGKSVDDALNILKYSKREASEWVEKLLLSAISNWENKLDLAYSADDYDLFIKSIFVDEAGMLKRFRPAPHGRAHRIRKRSNHVTVIIENAVEIENEEAEVEEFIEENTED